MNLFYTKRTGYLFNPEDSIDAESLSDYEGNIYFPFDIDSEFQTKHPLRDVTSKLQPRKGLTNQLKAIALPEGSIFAHPDIKLNARHPVFKDFSPIDYLKSLGIDASITRADRETTKYLHKYPAFEFDGYAFFAVAELGMIAENQYKKDLIALTTKGDGKPRIEQKRRLRTVTPLKFGEKDWVNLPWIITINGKDYRARLCIIDTSAVHGVAGYADFCKNAGIELKYKDNFTPEDKQEMERMYYERPEDFDNYALGDLYNYAALVANAENFKKIYEELEIGDYFQNPKLTIGATVRDIYRGEIAKEFGIPNDKKGIAELIEKVCKPGNARFLKDKIDTTLALNAKVRGGRCRNNKPTITNAKGVLCDNDISGCYGEGQRNQLALFGNPLTIEYPWNTAKNKYITLREFRKKYGKELVYGGWQAIVDSKEKLQHRQDYLVSWQPPEPFKSIASMPTDSDFQGLDEALEWLDKNAGEAKIFNYEIINGLIESDFLEWLDNVCSPAQRKELLDKLIIKTAIIYPASERVDNANEVLEKLASNEGVNTCELKIEKGKSRKKVTTSECHAWYGSNLGDLLITKLLQLRKKYPKKDPMNTLYKLIINTLYGDMVSPFFNISNVVTANNITARARALAWYMEKGLNGWQSITDGCVFDLNNVVYPKAYKYRVTAESVTNLYRARIPSDFNLVTKPLDNQSIIKILEWQAIEIDGKQYNRPVFHLENNIIGHTDSHQWIEEKSWQHLQKTFPNLSILHRETTDFKGNKRIGMFSFEVKNVYTSATFHGTANYYLQGKADNNLKMRSYESKKLHERYSIDSNNELIRLETGEKLSPSEEFLMNLFNNQNSLNRQLPFLKTGILKCGDYRNNYESRYKETNLIPGDTIYKSGMLREFSISQFTFQTRKQYESWTKELERLKRHYGQSYEMYFTDNEGNLNYQEMIQAIDTAIAEGKLKFIEEIDRNWNKARTYKQKSHPYLSALELLKEQLESAYEIPIDAESDDLDLLEWEYTSEIEKENQFYFGEATSELDDWSFLDDLDI